MPGYLELHRGESVERFVLSGDTVTIGRESPSDVVLHWDRRVGRAHAVLERRRAGWTLKDLGVTRGTLLNGRKLGGVATLVQGDTITIGETTLTYGMDETIVGMTLTRVGVAPPEMSEVERKVLDSLCAPIAAGDIFSEPATLPEICAALAMTQAAVEAHLQSLFQKFKIFDEGDRRRRMLAHEAVSRGALLVVPRVAPAEGPAPAQAPLEKQARPLPAKRAPRRAKPASPKARVVAKKKPSRAAKPVAAKKPASRRARKT